MLKPVHKFTRYFEKVCLKSKLFVLIKKHNTYIKSVYELLMFFFKNQ